MFLPPSINPVNMVWRRVLAMSPLEKICVLILWLACYTFEDEEILMNSQLWRGPMEQSLPEPPAGAFPVDTDEAELVQAAQADPSTFAHLYRRYLPRMYHYVRARLDREEDAADLTQQIFLHALAALPGYQPRGVPFAAWLFRIARHAVSDFYRRRRAVVSWDSFPEALWGASALQDMDALLLQRERLTRLKTLLARLKPAQRELLALRFAAGLSSSEIARVVGRSPAAVKKQLTRLLHTLKEQYHEQ